MNRLIGLALRLGTLLSVATIAAGGLLHLAGSGSSTADLHMFHSEPPDLRTLAGVVADAAALRAAGVIQLGVLLLIATPILRVLLASVVFALQRDWRYLGIGLLLFCILILNNVRPI